MMCVSLLTLLGTSWVLLPCEGQSLTVTPEKYYVLKGENVEIKWIISGIKPSTLGSRVWRKLPNITLATIRDDEKEKKINNTILGEGFDVKKPSTLILKNVTEDFDGDYRFNIISKDSIVFLDSDVTVVFLIKPNIAVNCPSPTTVNQSDYFVCECKGTDGKPSPANVTWYKDDREIVTGEENIKLVLSNVTRDDSGSYRCEAKSHEKAKNETSIDLIVNYAPESVKLNISGQLVMCSANGQPEPSYKIFLNETVLVNNITFTIPRGNRSYAGNYKCFAKNFLGNASSEPEYVFIQELTTTPSPTTIAPTLSIKPSEPVASSSRGTTTRPNPGLNSRSLTTSKPTKQPGPCPTGCIIGIVVGVLVFISIAALVLYHFKKRSRSGYKGNANVDPSGDGGVVVNQYELDEDNGYDSVKGDNAYDSVKGDNAYDSVNTPESSASTSKPAKDSLPPVYAAVDKNNREGKTLYATLDSVALESQGSQKRKDDRPPQTEYADINFLKKEADQNAGEAV